MERRHPHVINADEVAPVEGPSKGAYGSSVRMLGRAAGAKQLGCSLYEVAPGKAAFPFHWHMLKEEAIIVLSGTGTLRLGDAQVQVRAGDYVALPVGASCAHQLRNTGSEPLRYYALSTMGDAEVAVYPDSRKLGVLSMMEGSQMRVLFHDEDGKQSQEAYFAREPLAEEEPR
ncbi:MAG TPA: cupin domain-containing protein [Myxococcaceae bacterium]|nr:cupin domain-containing protein [Myxococcaceae bacterium]